MKISFNLNKNSHEHTIAEFDKIRPYHPEELPKIYEELIADPSFRAVVESVMPGIPFEALAEKMRLCRTNLEFQKAFFYGLLWDLVKKCANGLTFDCFCPDG